MDVRIHITDTFPRILDIIYNYQNSKSLTISSLICLMNILTNGRTEEGSTCTYYAVTCDFQQCGILISVDSHGPVQPPFKLRTSKSCSVSSLTVIEYLRD